MYNLEESFNYPKFCPYCSAEICDAELKNAGVVKVNETTKYLDKRLKAAINSRKEYIEDSAKWCAENLKSDVYEIVDGKCVEKKIKN